jgi:hypothetical protein
VQELQSVEVALAKLELLVKESEISGFVGGERLSADLDKIRSLKREVEVLEATFKAKAAVKEERIMELQVSYSLSTCRGLGFLLVVSQIMKYILIDEVLRCCVSHYI